MDCKNSMMFLTSFCFCQLSLIMLIRLLPMPSTCRSLSISSSITAMVSVPNIRTMRWANLGPTPLISPLPRYFSMPYTVAGMVSSQLSAMNCRPYLLSTFQLPSTSSTEPTLASSRLPTTATSSV